MNATRSSTALVLVAVLLGACGGSDGDPAPEPPAAEEVTGSTAPSDPGGATSEGEEAAAAPVITISEFEYSISGTVTPGSEVTVRNEDGVGHTVTSDDGLFDVAVDPGGEATFTAPEEPGEFPYHCIPHPNMTAVLVVG